MLKYTCSSMPWSIGEGTTCIFFCASRSRSHGWTVVAQPAAAITADELRAHCRALASSYKVPDRIEIRATLPVTETGKLFRRALREEAERLMRAG